MYVCLSLSFLIAGYDFKTGRKDITRQYFNFFENSKYSFSEIDWHKEEFLSYLSFLTQAPNLLVSFLAWVPSLVS